MATKTGSVNRTYVLLFMRKQFEGEQAGIVFTVMLRRGDMRLLRLAVENRRWDLAAHTIVLATARHLSNGEKPNAKRSKAPKRRTKG